MADPVRVGLLGMGTVGTGLVRLLVENGDVVAARLGRPLQLRRALVRSLDKPRAYPVPADFLTTDPQAVLAADDVDIVVEVMGGLEPADRYILEALQRGKPVVTANKEVLARRAPQLFAAAARAGRGLYFEASVAAGIPILRSLVEGLAANHVRSVIGIINGTTNYILTKMSEQGAEFSLALAEAQRAGYAEADPRSDVDGWDAAYKLAILSSLAFETYVPVDSIFVEGIRRITPLDLQYAQQLGFAIKLLAIAKQVNGSIEARVHPAMVPLSHPLAAVRDVFNAIYVGGDAAGELMLYGRGAGAAPTASAVAADLIQAADDLARQDVPLFLRAARAGWTSRAVQPIEETLTRFYLRFLVADQPGVLAAISAAFGRQKVSIESVIQKGRGRSPVDLVFVTHLAREANVRAALEEIRRLDVVFEVASLIRVEDAGEDGES
ncbi:MAG: homoserine dehydrogenase [Limnochordaceae bacterium]|nr:homoserine dehydrogenase [Limnochordaceae bacterium]